MSETKQAIAIQFHERLVEALQEAAASMDVSRLSSFGVLPKILALLSEISKAAE